jgi:hypothetical protein
MHEAKTKARMEAMMMAMQEYHQDRGYFPQQLSSGTDASAGWVHLNIAVGDFRNIQTARPYIEGFGTSAFASVTSALALVNDYVDAWNCSFQYTTRAATALGSTAAASEQGYWLRSLGPDKTADTADDINSWGKR